MATRTSAFCHLAEFPGSVKATVNGGTSSVSAICSGWIHWPISHTRSSSNKCVWCDRWASQASASDRAECRSSAWSRSLRILASAATYESGTRMWWPVSKLLVVPRFPDSFSSRIRFSSSVSCSCICNLERVLRKLSWYAEIAFSSLQRRSCCSNAGVSSLSFARWLPRRKRFSHRMASLYPKTTHNLGEQAQNR